VCLNLLHYVGIWSIATCVRLHKGGRWRGEPEIDKDL
jgi:hypothetical protein